MKYQISMALIRHFRPKVLRFAATSMHRRRPLPQSGHASQHFDHVIAEVDHRSHPIQGKETTSTDVY